MAKNISLILEMCETETLSFFSQVFGQGLSQVPQVCVLLSCGGEQVKVPQLMVDLCNHIRRNITTEGIFRKAGSAHRQSDLKVKSLKQSLVVFTVFLYTRKPVISHFTKQ